jgi:predicted alpha-1,2-mannosidase
MNRSFSTLILISILLCATASAQQKKLTSYVNPFIGTDGFGHTFPGAARPFGMVQLSPDTRTTGWENCSGYHSSNPTIIGFSHTHLSGTGAADYGDIMFIATKGKQLEPGDEKDPLSGYRSAFSKDNERAAPGYYRVMLTDHGIQAEMTATTRCGIQKYTIPAMDDATIILDLFHGIGDKCTGSRIHIMSESSVAGYRRSSGWAKDHTIYFYTEFSKPFTASGISDGKADAAGTDHTFTSGSRAWFTFKVRNYEPVLVRTGISTVSIDNARMNLEKEVYDWDFDRLIAEAKESWETELKRIEVEGGTKTERVNFYTALYHCMIAPNIQSDWDGTYTGMDGKVHRMERGSMYSVFSLWDTFRALHPLFTVIDPLRAQEFIRALLQKYRESGTLPVWELASNETNCMIGYHAVPVIADAYMKGLRDFDIRLAFEAMKHSAMEDRLGLKHYKSQGFIPADRENEAVSKTLEYAYDDWCIAQVAKDLKMQDEYDYFMKRAANYINVYDTNTGFMRGKKNGRWVSPFDPFEVSGMYTEANAWQYSWFVPHDIPGLMNLMGGPEKFAGRLNELFSTTPALTGRSQPDISGLIGQYAHGNEPSHHMAYLYNWTPQSNRTAETVRRIMADFYTNDRDGLAGNEDCGQMSAWYVFSAMGFYPVCPGDNTYAFGSPLFRKITIGKGTANTFTILADSVSAENKYTGNIMFNGLKQQTPLLHQQIQSGVTIEMNMTGQPSSQSFSTSRIKPVRVSPVPFLETGDQTFIDSTRITLSTTGGGQIRYTLDGTEPDSGSMLYAKPFYLDRSCTLRMKSFQADALQSFTSESHFIRLPYRRTVTYNIPYSHLYTAGGDGGLIDGIRGEPFVFGGWQGFHGENMEVTVDLGEVRGFSRIRATFLQQADSWIWVPEQVTIRVSTDGDHFSEIYSEKNTVSEHEGGSFVHAFESVSQDFQARYIRVTAVNRKVCPPWHPGAGGKAWIFADEITVE